MQRVSFNLKMNGWANTLAICTEAKQSIIGDTIKVKCEVMGVAERNGTINVKTSILTLEQPITVPSYTEGKDKTFTQFKVPKFTLIQIKDYLN